MNREGGRQKGRNDDLILEVSLVCETAQIPAPVVGGLSIRFTRDMSKGHPDAGLHPLSASVQSALLAHDAPGRPCSRFGTCHAWGFRTAQLRKEPRRSTTRRRRKEEILQGPI